jgi:hypothetical protein
LLLYDVNFSTIKFNKDLKIIKELTSHLKDEFSRLSCLKKVLNEIYMGIN